MLRPTMAQILREGESSYAFVVAVARRARELAEEAEANGTPLEVKPVTAALNEFASGKAKVSELVKTRDAE
ncbi:MAG: DNA-directed RNA polymerase subunit omega [Negativibacillus sp.]